VKVVTELCQWIGSHAVISITVFAGSLEKKPAIDGLLWKFVRCYNCTERRFVSKRTGGDLML